MEAGSASTKIGGSGSTELEKVDAGSESDMSLGSGSLTLLIREVVETA